MTTTPGTHLIEPEQSAALRRVEFHAMGTRCSLQFSCADPERASAFERRAVAWVQAFEAKYSRFQPDSLVSRINDAAGRDWVAVDAQTEALFELCDTLHHITRGILDPTMLPLIRLWDYKAKAPTIPGKGAIAAAHDLVGWKKVRRTAGRVMLPREGMALDFGGFGKEYAVDMVAAIAAEHGITGALVDFGHDMFALGSPPDAAHWHIGLEDPARPGTHNASIAVTNKGVASSGDYLRCFTIDGRRYGHIIDPRDGRPVANDCTQSTVVADNCLLAGVLSTTAFVLGLREGLPLIESFPGAEGLMTTTIARGQTKGFFNHVVAN
ncbi:MAG TPA: FAD:protein FMN transferase [Opitutaceae bacterium]